MNSEPRLLFPTPFHSQNLVLPYPPLPGTATFRLTITCQKESSVCNTSLSEKIHRHGGLPLHRDLTLGQPGFNIVFI